MNYQSKKNKIHDKQIETLSFICDALISVIKQVGSRGRDRMIVGFTTTYSISAYHH